MEKEIKQIISENLPEQVGNVLKARLEKAESDKIHLEELKKVASQYSDEISNLQKDNQKLREKLHWVHELEKRELEIEKRERNIELEISKIQLAEAEKRNGEMSLLVQTVFRSPVYRKHIDNMSLSSYDSMGRMNVTGAVPTNVCETID